MTGRRPLRLLLVTGTRADFGLWLPVASAAARRPGEVEVRFLVTGMHLDDRFGSTVEEVRASGVHVAAEVPFVAEGDSAEEMAASLGAAITGVAPVIARQRPEWLGVLGDRGEQLAAALVALHIGLPVAHVQGGERSLGAVDDALRDMISRTAHLHLVANDAAARRLQRLGEEAWRIRVVGAPGLDGLDEQPPASADLRLRCGLPADGDYLLVVFHPETAGSADPLADLRAVLDGVALSGLPALAIGPNADAGGRAMLGRLDAAAGEAIAVRTTVPRGDYVALLAGAAAIVGNSSSGLIEAPLLGIPSVTVGARQDGRTRGDNVIDVPAVSADVAKGIQRALDPAFRRGLSRRSPYGDGHAGPGIVDAILGQAIDDRLLRKEVAP